MRKVDIPHLFVCIVPILPIHLSHLNKGYLPIFQHSPLMLIKSYEYFFCHLMLPELSHANFCNSNTMFLQVRCIIVKLSYGTEDNVYCQVS